MQILMFLILLFGSVYSYEKIRFEDLPLDQCVKVKEAKNEYGERIVYYFKEQSEVIKVWSATYPNRHTFLKAVSSGFYEKIAPPIKKIIFDKDANCRGYILPYLKDSLNPSHSMDSLYRNLISASISKRMIYTDLSKDNVMLYRENPGIIDLDSVMTIEEFLEIKYLEPDIYIQICQNSLGNYSQFLDQISIPIDQTKLQKAWKIPTGGSDGKSYYNLQIDGVSLIGERSWRNRWNLLKNLIDFQGKKILELGCNTALCSIFFQKFRGSICTGVDLPDPVLSANGNPRMMEASFLIQEAFDTHIPIHQIDLNRENYETLIGHQFDVVICMSLLKWVQDKERLLDYLAKFKHVLYEGHDSNFVEIERFTSRGFRYQIVGKTQIGVSYS